MSFMELFLNLTIKNVFEEPLTKSISKLLTLICKLLCLGRYYYLDYHLKKTIGIGFPQPSYNKKSETYEQLTAQFIRFINYSVILSKFKIAKIYTFYPQPTPNQLIVRGFYSLVLRFEIKDKEIMFENIQQQHCILSEYIQHTFWSRIICSKLSIIMAESNESLCINWEYHIQLLKRVYAKDFLVLIFNHKNSDPPTHSFHKECWHSDYLIITYFSWTSQISCHQFSLSLFLQKNLRSHLTLEEILSRSQNRQPKAN